MRVIEPSPELEKWREGVLTSMRISAVVGSHQLCIFEQLCQPGLGAPMHSHTVEEILEVIDGQAEISIEDEVMTIMPNQSVIVPAGNRHGFTNTGTGTLKVRATLASPVFEATYDDSGELKRRYSPEAP
jgi:mannose-6-phosphate isomerase-like protein (cupin superfamily)